jgi:hypothetical protein
LLTLQVIRAASTYIALFSRRWRVPVFSSFPSSWRLGTALLG